MRVLVCGGREYDDWLTFSNYMYREFHPAARDYGSYPVEYPIIIHGDAKGADFMARIWAKQHNFQELRFPADWKQFGKSAGHIRNQQMLDEGKPDLVIAFPGGVGTKDMVTMARKAGVEVIEVAG
jgi:hypothetical protein